MTVTDSHSSLCAKRVIRQSPALMDFTVGLVDPVPLLAKWASGFLGEFFVSKNPNYRSTTIIIEKD